jgi:hypothetical protein
MATMVSIRQIIWFINHSIHPIFKDLERRFGGSLQIESNAMPDEPWCLSQHQSLQIRRPKSRCNWQKLWLW